MQFRYEAYNRQGNILRGTIRAQAESEARHKLKQRKLVVIKIEKAGDPKKKGKKSKIQQEDLIMFTRQAAVMIGAGISLPRALYTLADQIEKEAFVTIIKNIVAAIEAGQSFAESIAHYPKVFPPIYINMVKAGEINGELQKALERTAEQMDKEKQLHDEIKAALMYPVIVLSFAVLITIAMLVFLVPVFKGLFAEDAEIPLITQIVITTSDSLRGYWYLWLLVIAALILIARYVVKAPGVINFYENKKFKLPIIGNLIYKLVLARFSRTCATLLQGGIGAPEALENAGATAGSKLVHQASMSAAEAIRDGGSIAGTLQETGLFPAMIIQMVAIGEEAGQVPSLLDKVAEFYEKEVSAISKGLTTLLEPVMLIAIGGVVGGLLIAMYLPIITAVATQI